MQIRAPRLWISLFLLQIRILCINTFRLIPISTTFVDIYRISTFRLACWQPFIHFKIPSYGYNCFKYPQITFIISPFDLSCRLRCEKWYYMPYLVESQDFGLIGHVSSLPGGQITWPGARNKFFLFANDSTPSKSYIYIYYTTKSANWSSIYVGFRILGVRGLNHPQKGVKGVGKLVLV